MYLTIPTWLVFLFLCIASFAPVASVWPGWWMAYYSALLVCWILVSIAALRRIAREERKAKLKLARMRRRFRDATETEASETDDDSVGQAPAEEHRIPTLSRRRRGGAKDGANEA